ncbi:Uncharacterized protein HSRCO_2250 [Halanaeroarchaeum sp. HSR-CO]|uniref:hypothetical protein n=1 Tax=Halanaeroarchaeum sp. HSR-CO TaxID=2866382 RepID=UPI00217E3046|nr:hypothetical protein [Halanaeroarchaeum sp. HSR-CO]UWG48519.1 Uncharacterized protein HSRCO_2250 [Halanaeroarchaeum sp. HSR-CO]
MSHDTSDPLDDTIESVAEFEAALHQLLILADQNDVDPVGAWEYRNGQSVPDWEVVVSELAKQDD